MPEETPTPTPEPTPVETVAPVEPVEPSTPPDTTTADLLSQISDQLEVFQTTALVGFCLLIVCACILMVRAL